METSTDRVLGNRLQLMQPKDGYRAAIDPVLLAAFVTAQAGESVLDLGCGVGTAALCLAARCPDVAVLGIDLQPQLIALAHNNAAANALSARARFESGDLLDFTRGGFDHVMANPPYLARERASISPNPIKALANVEGDAKLAHWVDRAIASARKGGSVSFIHRADRAGELRTAMERGLGALVELPLAPRAGEAPKRVLMQGIKGAPSAFRRCAPWPLHAADGTFTPATERILRDAASLLPTELA
ncbi:tRNA1(Val) (adenine(37)-N6)-methyltransferase [Dongia sp.]|uniref:tRNA1(Val) (adenine(37)-N6)-methyltransferase n=1 Tax=Dongia sp. TaxID=1977262 RepID=UPI0035AD950E